ncbi:MAG: tetratricopeptide repeat protein, partial [Myxococcales bacterium]|nr:tetratricopeptide repeat protein [Myxococcales bacterium]
MRNTHTHHPLWGTAALVALCLAPPPADARDAPGRADARLTPAVERALADPSPQALRTLRKQGIPRARDQAMVALARGMTAYRKGRWATAAQALRQAADAAHLANQDMAQFFLGECHFHQGQYASAGRQYRELLKQHPHSEWRHRARLRLADVDLARPERRALGVRALQKAIDQYPEYPHPAAARLALGEAELARGQRKAAAAAFQELVHWSPMDPLAAVAQRHLEALAAL